MALKDVSYERLGRVARITLNRPQRSNAQSANMRRELDQAFGDAVADTRIRVIIVAASGRHFSSGHDISEPTDGAGAEDRRVGGVDAGLDPWAANVESTLRWRAIPKPTIAQVHGYCIFGGWVLASAMDLIVASDDAQFLPGYVQYFSVPWDLGMRKAKEILFEGRFMTANEALVSGFVSRVVPRDRLAEETFRLAESIAESDPLLLHLTKRAINEVQDKMGFREALAAAFDGEIELQMAGVMQPLDGRPRLASVQRAVSKLKDEAERGGSDV